MTAQRTVQSSLRMTEAQEADWIALAEKWGLSKNATVHRAIAEALALEEYDEQQELAKNGANQPGAPA